MRHLLEGGVRYLLEAGMGMGPAGHDSGHDSGHDVPT
jgi:hypothetical protein